MDINLITIKKASEILGVSTQTLRRWDESGRLVSVRGKNNYRYYKKEDINEYIKNNLKDIFKMAKNWTLNKEGTEPQSDFYCKDIYIFKARADKLERELNKTKATKEMYALVGSIVGEIGNNSFDHNLGNWPDIRGIFFAYDLTKRIVILADRGQGILATLKKVKPELNNHLDALKTAFTEIISGRAPEARGNGLKFVKKMVMTYNLNLFFQTGDAILNIYKKNKKLEIKQSTVNFHGCLALIQY